MKGEKHIDEHIKKVLKRKSRPDFIDFKDVEVILKGVEWSRPQYQDGRSVKNVKNTIVLDQGRIDNVPYLFVTKALLKSPQGWGNVFGDMIVLDLSKKNYTTDETENNTEYQGFSDSFTATVELKGKAIIKGGADPRMDGCTWVIGGRFTSFFEY